MVRALKPSSYMQLGHEANHLSTLQLARHRPIQRAIRPEYQPQA